VTLWQAMPTQHSSNPPDAAKDPTRPWRSLDAVECGRRVQEGKVEGAREGAIMSEDADAPGRSGKYRVVLDAIFGSRPSFGARLRAYQARPLCKGCRV